MEAVGQRVQSFVPVSTFPFLLCLSGVYFLFPVEIPIYTCVSGSLKYIFTSIRHALFGIDSKSKKAHMKL